MTDAGGDIAKIAEQERRLIFPRFDEGTAWTLGSALRENALAQARPIVVDIRLWDRPLFYAALPGSTANNADWVRRKSNTVRMFQKSTYRCVLENNSPPDRSFRPGYALPVSEYVLAGGGFPIRVESAGVIGAVVVSGLPERRDHGLVVEALCAHLGVEHEPLRLA